VAPQVVRCSNEVAFVPLTAIELSVMLADPELVRVTVCRSLVLPIAVLGNARDVALRVSVDPAAAPVPERATVCAVLEAESVKAMEAVSAPADLGVKVMV